MQVIFLPNGAGPSRNFRFRLPLVGVVAAGLLFAIGSGSGYLGYSIGHRVAGAAPAPAPREVAQAAPARPGPLRVGLAEQANLVHHLSFGDEKCTRDGVGTGTELAGVERLTDLQAQLNRERQKIKESRQSIGDQLDSLGQRVGQIQAQVARVNALGQQLTQMAGLDPDEFSFDEPPAMGGPEHPVPWAKVHEADLSHSLDMIEISLDKKENELKVLEGLLTDRQLHKMQYPQGWPAHGWVSSGYGYRTDPFTGRTAFHDGVDIAAPRGTPIRAMAAGVVSFSGQKPGFGNVVEINHGNGYKTLYAHASKLIAKVGERVEKGDVVALVGSTGRSTGPHVHVEVLKDGDVVNPRKYLISSR